MAETSREYDWCMGFMAAASLFAGHYDRYAELRDEYLDDASPPTAGEAE